MRDHWRHDTPSNCQKLPSDNTGQFVRRQINTWRDTGVVVHPEIAMEIAAYYQAPEGYGFDFASFATTGTVTKDLIDGITDERYIALSDKNDESVLELEALMAYIKSAARERVFSF